jgi:hypothetical protein
MKKILVLAAAALVGLPVMASAQIVGQCADCHTMHNSELGAPVALKGFSTTPSATPNQNLLRMDCIACHAQDPTGPSVVMATGGSAIPQVMHGGDDLAAGNFAYISTDRSTGNSRKGHNVTDLFDGGDDNGGAYGSPPGMFRDSTHGPVFSASTPFDQFTCAGSVGCHGTRSQTVYGYTDATSGVWVEQIRKGIAAISGAHHINTEGLKDPAQVAQGVHDGAKVAAGYRFIQGLKGLGNETPGDRWMNKDATSHNEYYGVAASAPGSSCAMCHVSASAGKYNTSSRIGEDSSILVVNQSMTGFCITCHGVFHSPGLTVDGLGGSNGNGGPNGVSGAFLRHPSDFVLPDATTGKEYQFYTDYKVSALVARPNLTTIGDGSLVRPGVDMVMCLSCHQAHATPNDGMLRFDYAAQIAGAGELGEGCLACHTTKGVIK